MERFDAMRPVPLPQEDNKSRPNDAPSVWLMSAAELERYLRECGKRSY